MGGYLNTGRMFAIECKFGDGEMEKSQERWIVKAEASGVLCLKCHNKTQIPATIAALLEAQRVP